MSRRRRAAEPLSLTSLSFTFMVTSGCRQRHRADISTTVGRSVVDVRRVRELDNTGLNGAVLYGRVVSHPIAVSASTPASEMLLLLLVMLRFQLMATGDSARVVCLSRTSSVGSQESKREREGGERGARAGKRKVGVRESGLAEKHDIAISTTAAAAAATYRARVGEMYDVGCRWRRRRRETSSNR